MKFLPASVVLIVNFIVAIFKFILYFRKDDAKASLTDHRDPSSKMILLSTIVAM